MQHCYRMHDCNFKKFLQQVLDFTRQHSIIRLTISLGLLFCITKIYFHPFNFHLCFQFYSQLQKSLSLLPTYKIHKRFLIIWRQLKFFIDQLSSKLNPTNSSCNLFISNLVFKISQHTKIMNLS